MSVVNVFGTLAVADEDSEVEEQLLKLEKAFAEAIVKNDLEGIGRLVTDDWIIIDPNGEIVDRARFFEVIKSGALTHDVMESEDFRVRVYGDSAVRQSNRLCPVGRRRTISNGPLAIRIWQ